MAASPRKYYVLIDLVERSDSNVFGSSAEALKADSIPFPYDLTQKKYNNNSIIWLIENSILVDSKDTNVTNVWC